MKALSVMCVFNVSTSHKDGNRESFSLEEKLYQYVTSIKQKQSFISIIMIIFILEDEYNWFCTWNVKKSQQGFWWSLEPHRTIN